MLAPGVLGTGEVLQALMVVAQAVAIGQAGQECERIARAVAADAAFDDVVAVRIVTGEHDAVDVLHRRRAGDRARARAVRTVVRR